MAKADCINELRPYNYPLHFVIIYWFKTHVRDFCCASRERMFPSLGMLKINAWQFRRLGAATRRRRNTQGRRLITATMHVARVIFISRKTDNSSHLGSGNNTTQYCLYVTRNWLPVKGWNFLRRSTMFLVFYLGVTFVVFTQLKACIFCLSP